MMSLAPPLEPHYHAGLKIGIDTISSKSAYEHAEQPSSKEQRQQEKPINTNPGQAHTLFTAHAMLDEELLILLPCKRTDDRLNTAQAAWVKSEMDSVHTACNHMQHRGTRGRKRYCTGDMQLARSSLTSQREDTAAAWSTHVWSGDLESLSCPMRPSLAA